MLCIVMDESSEKERLNYGNQEDRDRKNRL